MDNNHHNPDLVQAFSYVEHVGLNQLLKLAKPLICMTVASNSIILIRMCEQKNNYTSQFFLLRAGENYSSKM